MTSEVSALKHKLEAYMEKSVGRVKPGGCTITHIWYYPVETRSLVTKAMLTGGKLAKILGSFWDGFIIKFEDDPPSGF